MVALNRRSRLFRAFKPIIDGLSDKARDRVARAQAEHVERDFTGQWARTHPFSYDPEIIESTNGNPLSLLGRAIDGVHCGDLTSIALVALGPDGVIHTAWSDGDHRTLSVAARFLADDLKRAAEL